MCSSDFSLQDLVSSSFVAYIKMLTITAFLSVQTNKRTFELLLVTFSFYHSRLNISDLATHTYIVTVSDER